MDAFLTIIWNAGVPLFFMLTFFVWMLGDVVALRRIVNQAPEWASAGLATVERAEILDRQFPVRHPKPGVPSRHSGVDDSHGGVRTRAEHGVVGQRVVACPAGMMDGESVRHRGLPAEAVSPLRVRASEW